MTIIQQLIDKALEINADYIQILEYQSRLNIDSPEVIQQNSEPKNGITRFFYHVPSLIHVLADNTNISVNTHELFELDKTDELTPKYAFADPFTFRSTLSMFKLNADHGSNNLNLQTIITPPNVPNSANKIKTQIYLHIAQTLTCNCQADSNNIAKKQNFNPTTQNDFANLLAEIVHELSKINVYVLNFGVRGGGRGDLEFYGTEPEFAATVHKIQYIAEGVCEAYGKQISCYHSVL